MKEERVWITKDGRAIPWSKLTPKHRANIERMVSRNILEDTGEHDDYGDRDTNYEK